MVSAISRGGQMRFDVFGGSTNATRFVESFAPNSCTTAPTVFLIVDGLSAHTAKIVKEYVASTGGRLNLFSCCPARQSLG